MRRLSMRSMLVVLFSALYAISVSACGRAGGSASSPMASVFDASRSTQSIVSAAGSGEIQVQRYIADAAQVGKVARFVTVSTKNAKHVFPPTATMLHSGRSLIVLAYSRMYVWPLSAVRVTYSAKPDSAVDLTLLPAVSTPKLDRGVAKVETGMRPIRKKVPAGEQLCGDCVLLMGESNRRGKPDPWLQFEDPWQQHADYTSWQDPAIIAQTTASAGKSLSSVRVAQDADACDDPDSSSCYFAGMTSYYTGGGNPTPPSNGTQCVISSLTDSLPQTASTTLLVGESTTVSSTSKVASIPSNTGETWTVTGSGTLSSITGSSVIFTANGPGSATVTVYGAGGGCAPASITYTIYYGNETDP